MPGQLIDNPALIGSYTELKWELYKIARVEKNTKICFDTIFKLISRYIGIDFGCIYINTIRNGKIHKTHAPVYSHRMDRQHESYELYKNTDFSASYGLTAPGIVHTSNQLSGIELLLDSVIYKKHCLPFDLHGVAGITSPIPEMQDSYVYAYFYSHEKGKLFTPYETAFMTLVFTDLYIIFSDRFGFLDGAAIFTPAQEDSVLRKQFGYSRTELQILRKLLAAYDNDNLLSAIELAKLSGNEPKTIYNHLHRMYEKKLEHKNILGDMRFSLIRKFERDLREARRYLQKNIGSL